jgi:DNA repair photolyase
MAPLLPGLSDEPRLMREVVLAAREAGATHLWWNVLNLRPGTREHFLENLARDWPEQLVRYQRLYAGRAYLGKDVTGRIDAALTELRVGWVMQPRSSPAPRGAPARLGQLELPLASAGVSGIG